MAYAQLITILTLLVNPVMACSRSTIDARRRQRCSSDAIAFIFSRMTITLAQTTTNTAIEMYIQSFHSCVLQGSHR